MVVIVSSTLHTICINEYHDTMLHLENHDTLIEQSVTALLECNTVLLYSYLICFTHRIMLAKLAMTIILQYCDIALY